MTVHELIPTRTGVDLGKAQTVTQMRTMISISASYMILREFPRVMMVSNCGYFYVVYKLCQPGTFAHSVHYECCTHVTLNCLLTQLSCVYNRSL
jgi:hypothetical protein